MRKVRYFFEHGSGCCNLHGTCERLYAAPNLVIAWHIIRMICGLQDVLRLQYLHEHADGHPLVAGNYNLTLESRAWGIVAAHCTLAGCGRRSQRASPEPWASTYLARFAVDSLSLGPAQASAQEGSRLHHAARLNMQLGPILRHDQDRLPYALWERPNVDIAPQLAKLNRLLELLEAQLVPRARRLDLRRRGVGPAVRDVLGDGARQQHRLLRDHAHHAAQPARLGRWSD